MSEHRKDDVMRPYLISQGVEDGEGREDLATSKLSVPERCSPCVLYTLEAECREGDLSTHNPIH